MKKMSILFVVATILLLGAITFFACKKDNSTNSANTTTTNTINQVQTSESQDATADKVESDVDSQADNLEANGYTGATTKSDPSTCVTISIDSTSSGHKWPRTVTLTYNCNDTINGDVISQTGAVKIVVDTLTVNKKRGYSRSITFNNYTIGTDSSSVTLNGTRTVRCISVNASTVSATSTNYRLELKDSVTSNLTFNITYKNYSTTENFTRKAARLRDIILIHNLR